MALPTWLGGNQAATGEMPTQQSVDRRRQIAEALMRAGQQPTGLPGGWGAAASALTAALGGMQMRQAQDQQKSIDDDWNTRFTDTLTKSGADPMAVQSASMLPLDQKRQILGQIAATKLAPKQKQLTKVGAGDTIIDESGKTVFSAPAQPKLPEGMRTNPVTGQPEFVPGYLEGQSQLRKAGAPSTSVSLNTEKGLYGTLAEQQGKQYSDLYSRAQSAPDRIDRAARVRALLDSGAITGAGADYKLALARGLKAAGIYDNEDISNTELLGRELAESALESIKSSGLGGGTGFSNADRDFLEKVAGGKITQDRKTLQRIAELNDRAARAEVTRWNEIAGRLQPDQLKTLGMQRIQLPAALPQTSGMPNDVNQVLDQFKKDPKYSKFFTPPQ